MKISNFSNSLKNLSSELNNINDFLVKHLDILPNKPIIAGKYRLEQIQDGLFNVFNTKNPNNSSVLNLGAVLESFLNDEESYYPMYHLNNCIQLFRMFQNNIETFLQSENHDLIWSMNTEQAPYDFTPLECFRWKLINFVNAYNEKFEAMINPVEVEKEVPDLLMKLCENG